MFGPTPKPGSLPYRTPSGVAQDPVPLMSTEPDLSTAHPYSSVGFASKCMRHPWEGTIHQHTAIWADHRRRTARPVRDCTAIASLVAPCHSGEIQVRTARDCNHHQSCDPQRAMSSAEAAQAMSKEIQLSLGPDAGPNDDSAQVGEAARAREPRSRYRPDGSRRRTQGDLQQRRKAKQEGRLPPVAQAQANQGSLLAPVHSLDRSP